LTLLKFANPNGTTKRYNRDLGVVGCFFFYRAGSPTALYFCLYFSNALYLHVRHKCRKTRLPRKSRPFPCRPALLFFPSAYPKVHTLVMGVSFGRTQKKVREKRT
jgi:hypothetical protein